MSIADTLSDAVTDIDRYMNEDGACDDVTEKWVFTVRDKMERLRCHLDGDLNGKSFREFEYVDEKDEDDES